MAIDIFKLTPEQLEKYIELQSVVDRQAEKHERLTKIRDYYDGDQDAMLTERQQEYLGSQLTGDTADFPFAHNVVKLVVDMIKDRLEVNGFKVNGHAAVELDDDGNAVTTAADEVAEPASVVAAHMWQWWQDWRMDGQQSRLYKRAVRDAYAFVMVDYDAENMRPRATLHKLDDGDSGIVVHRDPEDENRILFISRYFWTYDPLQPAIKGKQRKTLYFPHEVRKYIQDGGAVGGWRRYQDPTDKAWPLPWRDRQGKPLGLTVIEFQDPDAGLVPGIIGLQNALNKAWLDVLAAADSSGFPVVVFEYRDPKGPLEPKADANQTGDDEFEFGPGHIVSMYGGTAKRLEPGSLDQVLRVVWAVMTAIAVQTRLPQHELQPKSGDWPSGEALAQAEAGLVSGVTQRQLVFGQSWADVMQMAYKLELTFGNSNLPKLKRLNIDPEWLPAATRMMKTAAEVANIFKQLGIPDELVWAIAGLTPEQIAAAMEDANLKESTKVATIITALEDAQRRAAETAQNAATAAAAQNAATTTQNGAQRPTAPANGANGANGTGTNGAGPRTNGTGGQ